MRLVSILPQERSIAPQENRANVIIFLNFPFIAQHGTLSRIPQANLENVAVANNL